MHPSGIYDNTWTDIGYTYIFVYLHVFLWRKKQNTRSTICWLFWNLRLYFCISIIPVDLPGYRLLSFLAPNSRIWALLGNCWPLSATCTVDSFPPALPLKSWSQVCWSYSGAWEQVTALLEMAKPANQVSLKGWLRQEEEHFQAYHNNMSSGVLRYNNKYFL